MPQPSTLGAILLAKLNDPRVLALMQRINLGFEVKTSPRYSRLEVTTRDGRKIVRETESFDVAFPRDQWADWLQARAGSVVGRRAVGEIEAHPAVGVELKGGSTPTALADDRVAVLSDDAVEAADAVGSQSMRV